MISAAYSQKDQQKYLKSVEKKREKKCSQLLTVGQDEMYMGVQ